MRRRIGIRVITAAICTLDYHFDVLGFQPTERYEASSRVALEVTLKSWRVHQCVESAECLEEIKSMISLEESSGYLYARAKFDKCIQAC